MNKKEIFCLIAACLLLIALRWPYTTIMPHGDEYLWVESAVAQEYSNYMVPHPPLSVWIYNLFYLFSYYSRVVPIIFNVITFLFSYLMLKEFIKIKESKTLTWFFGLFIFSFYNFIAATQIDIDGGILTALITASLFFFVRYEKQESKIYYILSAVMFGLAMLAKMTGLFIPMILGVYLIIKTKSLWQPIKTMLPFTLIGAAIFSIFPIFYHDMPRFSWIFTHSNGLNWYPTPLSLVYLLIWGTPLMLLFLAMSYKVINKKNMLLLIWALVPLVIYLFGKPFAAPFDRYLMVIIPPVLMIGALLMKDINLIHIGTAAICALILIGGLAASGNETYTLHSIKTYMHEKVFLFPITGPSGPLVGINTYYIIFYTVMALFLFVLLGTSHVSYFMCVSLNIFMIFLLLTSFHQPDLNDVKIEMLPDIMASSYGLCNEKSLMYRTPFVKNTKDYDWHGDIFLFDFPLKHIELDFRLADCNLTKTYSSKNQTFGYWYRCPQ